MKKLLCALLTLALVALMLPTPALAQGEDAEANGVYDPFAPENQAQGAVPEERHTYEAQSGVRPFASTSTDYRYVNVLLSQEQHESSIVWFTGNYALCDATGTPLFQVESDYAYTLLRNGTTIELRAADNTLLHAGSVFSFREYAPPAGLPYNYFKVEQASNGTSPSDRIYKGELYCSYQAKSGNYNDLWEGLYLVNRVYIEEYLKGVLSAEIGDSPYAAALQAQAIVARNFAVKSKRSDGRVFDVYDYNRSQVYFGIYVFDSTSNAVDATAGKLLLDVDDLLPIQAHYCDSNGGFTETSTNEWGGVGKSGDESVRYDGFDLRAVRGTKYLEEVTIPALPTGGETEVRSLITNVLIPALTDYSQLNADNVSVGGISLKEGACYAACRCHAGPDETQICKHFCSLDVTFTNVIVKGESLLSPVEVNLKDIDFYIAPANGRPLGFFKTGEVSHYWLVPNFSTTDTSVIESYVIRHARHGSGVGLSQRGALLRAQESQPLEDILAFYFPGCTAANFPGLYAADALADISTVAFSQTWDVLGRDAYVYKAMDEASFIHSVLRGDDCVKIAAFSSDRTWAKLSLGDAYGYIKTEAFGRAFTKIKVTNINQYYDVYNAPAAGIKLGKAYPNEVFELVQENAAPGYHAINFYGNTGYISSRYSRLLTAANAGDQTGIATYPITVSIPAGYTDNMLWVDGIQYAGVRNGDSLTISVYSNALTNAVMYQYNGDVPVGMTVWLLSYQADAYVATLESGLTNLLKYNGFSIRITGERGLRYWNGISAASKSALLGTGVNGYKLVEYGTVVYTNPSWYAYYPFIKDTSSTSTGKAYWTQDGKVHDLVFSTSGDLVNFTIVLHGYSDQQLSVNYPFRGYAILSNGENTITIYGPQMARSIYYVAKAYMGIYEPGTDAYAYVKSIVDIVEHP